MSYTRTFWKARAGTGLTRFLKTNETSTEVYLENSPLTITESGTPFQASFMQNNEDGVYSISKDVEQYSNNVFFNAESLFTDAAETTSTGAHIFGNLVYIGKEATGSYTVNLITGAKTAVGGSGDWLAFTDDGTNVYASVIGSGISGIYMQTGGSGTFTRIYTYPTGAQVFGLAVRDGYIYFSRRNDGFYKALLTGGAITPVKIVSFVEDIRGITNYNGDLYCVVFQSRIVRIDSDDVVSTYYTNNSFDGEISSNEAGLFLSGGANNYFMEYAINDPQETVNSYTVAGIASDTRILLKVSPDGVIYKTPLFVGNTVSVTSSFTLPVFPVGTRKRVYNASSGDITITLSGSEKIRGAGSYVLGTLRMIEIEKVSSTLWVLTVKDEDIIDDSSRIIDLDGNRTPDIPDDPAGVTYLQDAFATTDSFVGTNCTLSVAGGILKMTATDTTHSAARSVTSATNRQVIGFVRSSKTGTVQLRGTVGGVANTDIASVDVTAGAWYMISGFVAAALTVIQLRQVSVVSGDTLEWDWVYIGTGAYLSRISDKTGRNAMLNVACLPVRSPWGKAFRFNGSTSYLQAPTPVFGTTVTILIYVKFTTLAPSTNMVMAENHNSSTRSGISIRQVATSGAIGLIIADADSAQVVTIRASTPDITGWHSIKIRFDSTTSVRTQFDSESIVTTAITEGSYLSSTQLLLGARYVGGVPAAEWFVGDLIVRADARILTDDEIYAWSVNPRSVDSGITDPFSFDFRNLPTYADNAAATTAGLPVGKLYRTSTGSVLVRY